MARVCIISEDSATISRVINNANTRKISIIKGQCHEINFIIGVSCRFRGKKHVGCAHFFEQIEIEHIYYKNERKSKIKNMMV